MKKNWIGAFLLLLLCYPPLSFSNKKMQLDAQNAFLYLLLLSYFQILVLHHFVSWDLEKIIPFLGFLLLIYYKSYIAYLYKNLNSAKVCYQYLQLLNTWSHSYIITKRLIVSRFNVNRVLRDITYFFRDTVTLLQYFASPYLT